MCEIEGRNYLRRPNVTGTIMKKTGMTLLSLLCAFPLQVLAADTGDLMREFKGQSALQTRAANVWQTDYEQVLQSLLPALGGDDLKARESAQQSWEDVVVYAARPGRELQRMAIGRAMLKYVGANSSLEVRLWMLKMLELGGGMESVPAIAPLLNDADVQIRERARRALAHNPSPAAAQALRAALSSATTPEMRASLLNALGFRHLPENLAQPADAGQSVTLIGKYLQDTDATVATQAIYALGEIGNADALKLLARFNAVAPAALRPALTNALLESAARAVNEKRAPDAAKLYDTLYQPTSSAFVRQGALRGLVLTRGTGALPQLSAALMGNDEKMRAHAARLTLLLPGANSTKMLGELLPKLPASAQVSLLGALADRGDNSVKSAVVALQKSPSADVKIAATNALGALGNSGDVDALLMMAAAEGDAQMAARGALGMLGASGNDSAAVNAKLMAALNGNDAARQSEAIRALTARRATAALPALMALLKGNGDVAKDAARAVGEIGAPISVPVLITWFYSSGEAGVGEKAISAIYNRSDKSKISPDYLLKFLTIPNLAAPMRATTFRLLGTLGSAQGFERVSAATKDNDAEVSDAAIRALADWPSPQAIPTLLEVARDAKKPVQNVLALRGVARLVGRSDQNANEKVAVLKTAMEVAKRGEEKQLLLGTLGDIKTLSALKLAEPLLADDGLKDSAAATIAKISEGLKDQALKDARPILEKALAASGNDDTKKKLQEQIKRTN